MKVAFFKDFIFSEQPLYRVVRHLFLFFGTILLFTFVSFSDSSNAAGFVSSFLMVTVNALFFFGYAYLTVYILVPYLAFKQKYLSFILLFLFSGLLISALKFQFSDFLFYNAISPENSIRDFKVSLGEIITNTKDMSFIVALFAVFKFARDYYHEHEVISELERGALETEIQMLQNQLDPHVLFNNLNNLYSISISSPEKLESQVVKLRSILNYILKDSRQSHVALRNEILMIRNYIGMEKLRYGERLKLEFTVEGVPGKDRIVPLLLFSFVENCFEHGSSTETGSSWINIWLGIQDRSIHFIAENSMPDMLISVADKGYAGSIQRIRRRLELLYPGRYQLSIVESRERFKVDLKMELTEDES